jgi:hypothetical protein
MCDLLLFLADLADLRLFPVLQVLELMKEVTAEGEDEGQHSDLSPYHSDSDSAVMMSGNSPYISKVSNSVQAKERIST